MKVQGFVKSHDIIIRTHREKCSHFMSVYKRNSFNSLFEIFCLTKLFNEARQMLGELGGGKMSCLKISMSKDSNGKLNGPRALRKNKKNHLKRHHSRIYKQERELCMLKALTSQSLQMLILCRWQLYCMRLKSGICANHQKPNYFMNFTFYGKRPC